MVACTDSALNQRRNAWRQPYAGDQLQVHPDGGPTRLPFQAQWHPEPQRSSPSRSKSLAGVSKKRQNSSHSQIGSQLRHKSIRLPQHPLLKPLEVREKQEGLSKRIGHSPCDRPMIPQRCLKGKAGRLSQDDSQPKTPGIGRRLQTRSAFGVHGPNPPHSGRERSHT